MNYEIAQDRFNSGKLISGQGIRHTWGCLLPTRQRRSKIENIVTILIIHHR